MPRAADALIFALGHPGEEASTVVTVCALWEVALPSGPLKVGLCPALLTHRLPTEGHFHRVPALRKGSVCV